MRGLELFSTVVWGCVPPLSILLLYYRRVRSAPPLKGLIGLFGVGIFAGLLAWGGEWLALTGVKSVLMLKHMPAVATQNPLHPASFESLMLRQIGLIAPIEEGCKLAGVVLPLMVVIRRDQRLPAQPSTVLLATFAVAMGFAAQENTLAIWHNPGVIVNRTIGAPMHALFSAPWGLALGFSLSRIIPHTTEQLSQSNRLHPPNQVIRSDKLTRPYKLTIRAWVTACLVHAGSNCWVYLSQVIRMSWLVYPLFAWWLWLWWQTEGMLARSQGELAPKIITATGWAERCRERSLAITLLGIGAAAINTLRDLGNGTLLIWELRSTWEPSTLWFVGKELLQAVILSAIALYLFRYLRQRANRS